MTVEISRVPVYPVVRLELRDMGDEFAGFADGVPIGTGSDEGPLRDALIAHAATVAAHRPGTVPAVRAVGVWGDQRYDLIVTSEGEVLDASSAGRPAAGASGTWRRRKWLPLALVAGVAIPGLCAGIVAVSSPTPARKPATSSPSSSARTVTAVPTQLPVQAPSGWSAVASWSAPIADLSAGLRPAVAGSVVVVPTGDGSTVAGLDGATGATRWTAQAGEPITVGVESSRVDGRAVVAAATSSTVFAWDAQTGRQLGRWKVPTGAEGVLATATGLVVMGPGQHVHVATSKGLVPRVLPAGASVVGVAGTSVLAAGDGHFWTVASDRVAGAPRALPSAPKGQSWRGVVGQTSTSFVVAYGSPESATVSLRGIRFSGQQQWSSQQVPQAATSSQGTALWVAPTGTYGVYGTSVLDMATGATRKLPADWTTSGVGGAVYGTTAAGSAWVDPSSGEAHASTAPADGSAPAAALGDVGGLGLISARDGDNTVLYAVPRVGSGGHGG